MLSDNVSRREIDDHFVYNGVVWRFIDSLIVFQLNFQKLIKLILHLKQYYIAQIKSSRKNEIISSLWAQKLLHRAFDFWNCKKHIFAYFIELLLTNLRFCFDFLFLPFYWLKNLLTIHKSARFWLKRLTFSFILYYNNCFIILLFKLIITKSFIFQWPILHMKVLSW